MSSKSPRVGRSSFSKSSRLPIELLESRTMLSASLHAQTIAPTEPVVAIVASKSTATRAANGTDAKGTFTVSRSHTSTKTPLTVNFNIDAASTASNGVDFVTIPGTVVIPKGHGSATVNINPLNDAATLAVEKITLDLQSGSYTNKTGKSAATITINDKRALASIAATQPAAQEHGLVAGQFTVTRTGSTQKPLTVSYALDPASTATSGVDFAALIGSVVIPKGQTQATITLTPIDAGLFAGSKTVILDLSSGTYGTLRGSSSATVTIADNDTPPVTTPVVDIATVANASDVDPSGAGLGRFSVTRAGDTTNPLTVDYVLSSANTALPGVDFAALPGSVVIPAGQSSATIDVTAIDAGLATVDKSLTVTLANSGETNASLISATMTISEHQANVTPIVDISTLSNASEVNPTTTGVGQFQVTRQGSTAADYTVNYAISGTAVAGTNYVALSGSVVIPAGQSSAVINLTPINDNLADGAKTVILTVTNTSETNSALTSATVSIADAGATQVIPEGWWNTSFHDRVPLQENVGAYARTDMPVDQSINFTTLLSTLSQSGQPLNLNSLRVVETSADGKTVVDANVPFQFDRSPTFDATTNASGDLVFILSGSSAANTTRYYHVYFDTGANFTAETITPMIATNTNTSDEGQSAIEVDTVTANYFLQTQNGGFSSIVDKSGNDWLNFNNTPNSMGQGQYRGLPNAVLGGGFHPGFTTGSTTVVSTGPLKTTLLCTVAIDTGASSLSNYTMMYEFYPTFVRATMLSADANYWFLYEGTPGGTLNNNDQVGQSNGTVQSLNTAFTDPTGLNATGTGEWAYFDSVAENRFLYIAKNNPTSQVDSYFLVDLTVFGLGRDNSLSGNQRELLSGQNTFTFGLADGGNSFSTASNIINGAYQPVTAVSGSSQDIH